MSTEHTGAACAFPKLRFQELARSAVAIAAGGAVALHPIMAAAATGSVGVTKGGYRWFLNTNITFGTTSSNWGFSEASGTHSTASGQTPNDAFDGALSWLVSTGVPDDTTGYQSPGGVVSITGDPSDPAVDTTVLGNPQTMSGLTVQGEAFFPHGLTAVRSILILTNPTGAPITVNVDSTSNLGSDNNTTILGTSSGDTTWDATDNWVASWQFTATPPTSDPGDTLVFSGAGAAVRPLPVTISSRDGTPHTGSDREYLQYIVTVPAGQTRRLMVFAKLTDPANIAAHEVSDAAIFNTPDSLTSAGLLQGLSNAEMSEIVNWPALFAVPTLGQWALVGFGGALGLTGALWVVFRRRFNVNDGNLMSWTWTGAPK